MSASITTEVDGQGTLIASESSILNDNRNPGQAHRQMEAEFGRTLGIQKVLWVPGVKGVDDTHFRMSAVARFVQPSVVLLASPGEQSSDDGSNADAAWITAHR